MGKYIPKSAKEAEERLDGLSKKYGGKLTSEDKPMDRETAIYTFNSMTPEWPDDMAHRMLKTILEDL